MLEMQETRVPSLGQEDPLEKGTAYPRQCFCLGNPMDRGAWWATVHGVAESQIGLCLHVHACTHIHTHTHTHRGADLHLGDTHCGRTCGVYLSSDFLLTPELFIIFIGCYTFFSYTGQLCHQLTALLLWWLTGREPDCQCRVCKRHRFDPWVRIPLEVEMATTPVFLPGESQGQRSLAGYSLWDHKESDTT